MQIKFYNLEDTEQLERDICLNDRLVMVAEVGDGEEYNPYDFSNSYCIEYTHSMAGDRIV